MAETGSLEKFAARLHPDVVADIAGWAGDETLGKLYLALTSHVRPRNFFDTYAEALVARHLRARGCDLQFEVPTPSGRACDFEVRSGDQTFYLHVKRLNTGRPARRRLTVSSRLRYLERIERPYVVSVRWHERATDEHMQRLVESAAAFIRHARVGDELVVHDDAGREIGGVLVVAPWEGKHVSLAIGLPSGFIDEAPRIRRLLERACRQFMPRAANLILVCTSQPDDREDFENAVLGSHVERWDAFPPSGRRIAHGRADDGLWRDGGEPESQVVGWFHLAEKEERLDVALLFRDEPALDPALRDTLERLFTADGKALSR